MTTPFACPDDRGPGPCTNTIPHVAPRGCVHSDSRGSWVPDRHDKPGRGDGE